MHTVFFESNAKIQILCLSSLLAILFKMKQSRKGVNAIVSPVKLINKTMWVKLLGRSHSTEQLTWATCTLLSRVWQASASPWAVATRRWGNRKQWPACSWRGSQDPGVAHSRMCAHPFRGSQNTQGSLYPDWWPEQQCKQQAVTQWTHGSGNNLRAQNRDCCSRALPNYSYSRTDSEGGREVSRDSSYIRV